MAGTVPQRDQMIEFQGSAIVGGKGSGFKGPLEIV